MIGGGRGEGRHCVAGGGVLLPDGTANRRCLSPFSRLENCAAEKLCVLSQAEKGLVTEKEPNPDLPLSVADSQCCSSFLQVVLTLFIMWVDANLMMLQGEK